MRFPHAALVPLVLVAATAAPAAAPADAAPAEAQADHVDRLDVDVTLEPASRSLQETASLRVAGHAVSRVAFTLDEGLAVRAVKPSAGEAEFHQAGSELTVDLDPPLDGSRTLTFALKGVPHLPSEVGPARAVLAPAAAWYPIHARAWGPASVTVHAPAGWTVVGPGSPTARMAAGTSRWTCDKPIRSIAVAAAPGLSVESGTLVRVPFRYAGAGTAAAKSAAERLAPGMAWLSGALAPYPFEGFLLALLPGYDGRVRGSGVMIAGAATPLGTDSDGADVLAGQWFGELLAGDGAWIDGFAAWEACVFARDRALPLPADVVAARAAYFELRSGDVALAKAGPSTPAAVVRGKGSAALDMVRLVAGDRATFDAVRALFREPVGPPIPLAAVRQAIEAGAGHPLDRVFSDWFERSGAPQIEGTLRGFPAAGGGFRADVTLSQKRGAYAVPVEIVIYGPGAERRETVEISDETTSVFYVVPFEPKRLEIDPLDRIFRRK